MIEYGLFNEEGLVERGFCSESEAALAAQERDDYGDDHLVVREVAAASGYRVASDVVEHVNYPHWPGRLFDCPACEASCHCKPNETECVFEGQHNGLAVQ